MPCNTASVSAQNLRKRGSAAAGLTAGWTPTGDRKVAVRLHPDTRMYYLEVKFSPRQSAKSKDFKIITSMAEACHGVPSFLGMLPKKTWATQQAAERAISHFREWVDGGRRQQNAAMRAGASSEARAAAVCKLDAPQRFSGRLNLSSPSVAVSINFIEGRAQVKFAPRAPAQLSQEEHSALWQVRSRPMQQVLVNRQSGATQGR